MPPISPAINAYMQQDQPQGPSSAEALFNNAFTTQAHNALQAKYPVLTASVITFKIMDSDVSKGNAFGVFILRYRGDVRHIPVVMCNGNLKSCEMVYDRNTDQMYPLTEDTVNELSSRAFEKDHSLLDSDVNVENTRGLMRNIVRPPYSSNVALASSRMDMSELPDNCKSTLYNYYLNNKNLLAKVAEFYSVSTLGEKLAVHNTSQHTPQSSQPEVISLDNITKQAAVFLTPDEREHLLSKGYVVKYASDDKSLVLDATKDSVVESLGVEEIHFEPKDDFYSTYIPQVKKCEVLCFGNGKLEFEPALVFGRCIVFKNHSLIERIDRAVVRGFLPVTDVSELVGFGLVPDLHKPKNEEKYHGMLFVVTPNKNGYAAYKLHVYGTPIYSEGKGGFPSLQFWDKSCCPSLQLSLTMTYEFKSGSLWLNDETAVVPSGTFLLYIKDWETTGTRIPRIISTIHDLIKFSSKIGHAISISNDGIQTSVTDKNQNKTASFGTLAKVAEYLVNNYGLSAEGVDKVLSQRDSIILTKQADAMPMQQPMPQQAQPMPMQEAMPMVDQAQMPAPMPVMQQQQQFNPQPVQDAAELQDPEILEAGSLAAFAQEPDVKSMLVDYLPDFLSVLDRLGRVILLFSIDYENMVEFYGKEKLENLIGCCRRVFKTVGDIVADLKKFVNM